MIYENEELRLRTININAEVERGEYQERLRVHVVSIALGDLHLLKKNFENFTARSPSTSDMRVFTTDLAGVFSVEQTEPEE